MVDNIFLTRSSEIVPCKQEEENMFKKLKSILSHPFFKKKKTNYIVRCSALYLSKFNLF